MTAPKDALLTCRAYFAKRPAARIGFRRASRICAGASARAAPTCKRDFTTLCINRDLIAGLDQGQRAAERRFRRHMPDHEAMAAAGKPSVGDQRDLLPRPLPMMALVGLNISRMPGPPFGPS